MIAAAGASCWMTYSLEEELCMNLLRNRSLAALVVIIAVALICRVHAEGNPDVARKGEGPIEGEKLEKALAEISDNFKKSPKVKARMTTKVSDLMGDRTEEGVFLLNRGSGTVLRQFEKPDAKYWLLSGTMLSEYVP